MPTKGRTRTAGPRNAPRIYLAGPEVFFADALDLAREKKRLCARHGFQGVFPLDVAIEGASTLPPADTARAISRANESLIRGCDLLIANCTPFRGVSMDAGTAYEIGFARALGKPVFGYTNVVADYKARAERHRAAAGRAPAADRKGSAIEDFGLAENLMIAMATGAEGIDLVRTRVARALEFTDLTGFKRCLVLAKKAWAVRATSVQGTYARRPRPRNRA